MAAELILVNDIVNKRLIKAAFANGYFSLTEAVNFPQPYQYESYVIKYFPVVPSGNTLRPWTQVAVGNLTVKMGIGPITGAEVRLAAQDTWTPVTTADSASYNNYLTATLNLNTTLLNAALTGDTLSSYFEIQLGESGVYRVVYQTPITVKATVIDSSGTATLPQAAASYYTKDEIDNGFVKFSNAAGAGVIITSPNGKQILLRAVDEADGSATFRADNLT